MGFNRPQWKFVNKSFKRTGLLSPDKKLPRAGTIWKEEGYYGKNMLELGCQQIRDLVRKSLKSKGTAKSYFKSIGINHTSMDITGCLFSLKRDLRKPLDEEFHNSFDIITNSGTTEHVVPLEGQYQAFKNIHECAKVGCVMLHILPGIGKYYGHCQIYYDYGFFENLARANDYEIVSIEDVKRREKFLWRGVCFIKKSDSVFSDDKESFFEHIQYVSKKKMKQHKKNKNMY